MNKKTRVVLSSLALLTLSIGLVACKKQATNEELQAHQQSSIRPIIDFDQDDDPYPDDYVLDNVPDENDSLGETQKTNQKTTTEKKR